MESTDIKALGTKELVALYNRLTKKSIKKFSSRAAGEKQVAAALIANNGKARIVHGKAGNKVLGRPALSFVIELTPSSARSKPNTKSLRRQLLDWLEAREGKTASIEEVESKFNRNMRGVVNKLEEKGWLKSREAK